MPDNSFEPNRIRSGGFCGFLVLIDFHACPLRIGLIQTAGDNAHIEDI